MNSPYRVTSSSGHFVGVDNKQGAINLAISHCQHRQEDTEVLELDSNGVYDLIDAFAFSNGQVINWL